MQQFIAESMVLALAGGFLATPMSWWGSLALVRMISTGDSRVPAAVDPDWRIFAFTAAVSLLTGILFGLAPAVRSTRADPGPVMKEGTRHTGRSSHTLDRTLVVAQVALSVVLITGAGLFLRTLQKLWNVNMGYGRENVLMLSVDARLAGYPSDPAGSIYREILRRLQALPGVNSASASIVRPVDDQFYLLDQVDAGRLQGAFPGAHRAGVSERPEPKSALCAFVNASRSATPLAVATWRETPERAGRGTALPSKRFR